MIGFSFLVGIGTFAISMYFLNRRQRKAEAAAAIRRLNEAKRQDDDRAAMVKRLREAA